MPVEIASDLLERGLLSRYPECVVCGSPERTPYPLSFQSDRYVRAAARSVGVAEKTFFDSLEGQKCKSCGALYFDPWLSARFQKELYENLYPQHNVGWDTFWSTVRNPEGVSLDADGYEMIREKIPSLRTYAELGCPFAGFLPYLSLKEYRFRSKKFWDYPGTYAVDTPIGKHPRIKGNRINLERVGRSIAQSFNRSQLMRVFTLKRLIKRSLIRLKMVHESRSHGVNCYYIRHDSTILWGKNCKSLGIDCRTAAEKVFGIQILDFEDIQTEKIRFDLVGIFNSLDHFKNPLRLLRRLFEFTDYVYIEGQHSQAGPGKQHLYFLEEETVRTLPELLHVAEAAKDFRKGVPEHWYSILLRKRNEFLKIVAGMITVQIIQVLCNA
jgi:hypothetical protein